MPYLFCRKHGHDTEAATLRRQDELRQIGECVLIVEGTLTSGPWLCDRCNVRLAIGKRAWLHSAFPRRFHDDLADYDFAYELGYFAMTHGDRVASYGIDWPDDSLDADRIAECLAAAT